MSTKELAQRAVLVGATVAGHVWRNVTRHGTAVAAVGALSYGAGQVYGPAGWMVFGGLLLADRVVDDVRAARRGGGRG